MNTNRSSSLQSSTAWRKSTYSDGGDNCVEVAGLEATAGVRDTKARDRGHLELGPHTWRSFLDTLKRG
ncbi:DUF397 domain-containing protein [Streptodolium elevatio]|uniref:DUF397 domain-containing protein n=1 Tax=Streptodolium elevatio TaxID=3157996 RepID=A0ABV3DL69_9ACTN